MKMSTLYRSISIETWNRMEFAHKMKFKFSETTITENLLYKINQFNITSCSNFIEIYEAKNEKRNGNDLEMYLEIYPDVYIFLAIQAKKLYIKEEKYKTINHKVGSTPQIELLLKYAKSKKGIPLYLLYNYNNKFSHKYKEIYGCSIVKAKYIKKVFFPNIFKRWKIPKFNDLHVKHAIPFMLLGNIYCIKKYFKDEMENVKFYKYDELIDNNWINIKTLSSIDLSNQDKDIIINDFSPKYKIILNTFKNKELI